MHFETPWALLLLLLVPVVLWPGRRKAGSVRFSSTRNLAQSGRSLRQRLAWLPACIRALVLISLAVALARPQKGLERVREVSKGVAIEMVVDRSGSMQAEMEYKGERLNRLEVVKRVFQEFVMGDRHELEGRPSDLIGMIAFARYPDTVCPLTLAHGALPRFLDTIKLVQRESEDGTAIGDAIALAAARLKTAEQTLALQVEADGRKEYEIKSKVIILLTDGENNCGNRDPMQAAELAAKWGIKLYTIGIGGGDSVSTVQTLFGAFKMGMGSAVDERTLKSLAEATGGVYRRADSAKALHAVYKEIDELEKSRIESVRYMDYREEFVPWALAGLCLLALETLLRATMFRRTP